MARALLVGCGCRGRALGRELIAEGWLVRGTTRSSERAAAIGEAGIEPAVADPNSIATVLDLIDDVTVLCWLLGSAVGGRKRTDELHGSRLERLLEEIVDTPVRAVVYEAVGSIDSRVLEAGARIVADAEARWRIPARIVTADPEPGEAWVAAAKASVLAVIG